MFPIHLELDSVATSKPPRSSFDLKLVWTGLGLFEAVTIPVTTRMEFSPCAVDFLLRSNVVSKLTRVWNVLECFLEIHESLWFLRLEVEVGNSFELKFGGDALWISWTSTLLQASVWFLFYITVVKRCGSICGIGKLTYRKTIFKM